VFTKYAATVAEMLNHLDVRSDQHLNAYCAIGSSAGCAARSQRIVEAATSKECVMKFSRNLIFALLAGSTATAVSLTSANAAPFGQVGQTATDGKSGVILVAEPVKKSVTKPAPRPTVAARRPVPKRTVAAKPQPQKQVAKPKPQPQKQLVKKPTPKPTIAQKPITKPPIGQKPAVNPAIKPQLATAGGLNKPTGPVKQAVYQSNLKSTFVSKYKQPPVLGKGRQILPIIKHNSYMLAGAKGYKYGYRPFWFTFGGRPWYRYYYTVVVAGVSYWYWNNLTREEVSENRTTLVSYAGGDCGCEEPPPAPPACDCDDDDCGE
jgi:hypothetical protein